MFTGIVEELGTVASRDGSKLRISATRVLEGSGLGDSIAVNGCCLTVVDIWSQPDEGGRRAEERERAGCPPGSGFCADVTDETFARTCLGDLQPGSPVNLERPVRLDDRLGGHLVQGHVDAVGEIVDPAPDLRVRMPEALTRYIVEKGSITVDGVSLTVVDPRDDGFTVALIPHTEHVTTLGLKGPGDRVNLEVDIIAKYTEKLLAPRFGAEGQETEE
ncbi:MAG: riboflavin synthase [Actinobacteria bacterium]|nr:riboflavin synthase [Actinomycetota bacterium]